MAQPKPNTYDSKRHDPIFQNVVFLNWAKEIMQRESFKSEVVSELTEGFKIWSSKSIILPSFLVHILNPRIFPLYDQHVERSRRFFSALSLNNNAVSLSLSDYEAYHKFWFQLLTDLGIQPNKASLELLKNVDNALWTIGKYLKFDTKKQSSKSFIENTLFPEASPMETKYNTSSPEFKNLVLSYCNTGSVPQQRAMEKASKKLNITLPDSYLKYPGSHIDRWRKQGFPKKPSNI